MSTQSLEPSPHTLPSVLIAGAGLGGLLLAILLEHAKVPYRVLERASSVKPIGIVNNVECKYNHFSLTNQGPSRTTGAALSLNANVLSVMEQIGIYDDLMKVALPCLVNSLYNEDLKKIILISVT